MKNFKSWFKSALTRAVKTFAQTFLATIGTGAAVLGDVNWAMTLSSAGLAAVLSMVTSFAGLPEVKKVEDTPSEVVEDTSKSEEV